PEAGIPAVARKLRVLVLGELEVGLTWLVREGSRDRAAAIELPEGEAERDRVREPHHAPAGKQLSSRDAGRRVRNQRGDQNDHAEHVEEPDEGKEADDDLPPPIVTNEAFQAQDQRGREKDV